MAMRPPRSQVLASARPVLDAYALALLSTCATRILSLLIKAVRGKITLKHALAQCIVALKQQLGVDRFPTACAILVGSATVLPKAIAALLNATSISRSSAPPSKLRRQAAVIQLVSSFCAGLLSFSLLNRRESKPEHFSTATGQDVTSPGNGRASDAATSATAPSVAFVPRDAAQPVSPASVPLAGRTMDLTLFGLVRATDVLTSSLWAWYKSRHIAKKSTRATKTVGNIDHFAAPASFAISSAVIMWAWFHTPHLMPRSYVSWISSAAQIDMRLIQALRECHEGTFVYGKETGRGYILESMARDLGFPVEWGNPATTIPIPCELYHSGSGKSCEWHAITRFLRGWSFAMRMYLPLNLIVLLRRKPTQASARRAVLEASRSSAFLGAFVALFYYGVCLARNRVGPKVFSSKQVSPQRWDGGLGVGTGCMLCGWSILLEKVERRQEIAFFVAPRALATMMPRRYDRAYMWREQVVFAASAAIVLTAATQRPQLVRGVFGRLLSQVVR